MISKASSLGSSSSARIFPTQISTPLEATRLSRVKITRLNSKRTANPQSCPRRMSRQPLSNSNKRSRFSSSEANGSSMHTLRGLRNRTTRKRNRSQIRPQIIARHKGGRRVNRGLIARIKYIIRVHTTRIKTNSTMKSLWNSLRLGQQAINNLAAISINSRRSHRRR